MTKANMFKYGIAALLLVCNISIHAAPLTMAETAKLQQQLDAVKKNMVEASMKIKNGTLKDQVAMSKLLDQQNNIKCKLAGRKECK